MSIVTAGVQGLTPDQVAALGQLCAQSRLALAVIFGSCARGAAVASSDLDLLVLPATGAPFDLLGFEAAAQRTARPLHVDVTVLHPALSSALAWDALSDATVLWEEAPSTYEREMAAWQRRFLEDAPRQREQAQHLTRTFLLGVVAYASYPRCLYDRDVSDAARWGLG